ncbi:MAG: DUF456 domain-containing protein [Burkholderiales bacterium]
MSGYVIWTNLLSLRNDQLLRGATLEAALIWALALVLVAIGTAGAVIPAVPGAPLVFIGLLLAAWIDDYQKVGFVVLAVLGILTVFSLAVDLLAPVLGAKRTGASRGAVLGASVGTLIGLLFGFAGLVLGPFIGAVIGDYRSRRDLAQAGMTGLGAWLGLVIAMALKLGVTFAMLGVFATAYLF